MSELPVAALAALLHGRVDAVVIGASAGGVEALSLVLPALPADAAVAVLIVLHLPRERPSLLAEIFQPKCAVRVREAQDKDPIERGAVYFAPPDYHLLVDGEPLSGRTSPRIALSTDEEVHFSRPSIDVLFESAAEVYGERLLGIILTGASGDGAAGLNAVYRVGGRALVQRPDTAQAPLMAESALARTPAAVVLTLDEIASLLRTLDGRSLT